MGFESLKGARSGHRRRHAQCRPQRLRPGDLGESATGHPCQEVLPVHRFGGLTRTASRALPDLNPWMRLGSIAPSAGLSFFIPPPLLGDEFLPFCFSLLVLPDLGS